MSEAKHTPGPWDVDPELHDFDFGAPQKDGTRAQLCRYVHAPEGGGGRIAQCFANCLVTTTAELEANALLIAAAPALFDALKALDALYVRAWDTTEGALWFSPDSVSAFEEAHERARAAIAKALGESSHG